MERYIRNDQTVDPVTGQYVDGPVSAPVTRQSRITGIRRERDGGGTSFAVGNKGFDWSACWASVVIGLGLTLTLALLGIATGLINTDKHTGTNGVESILSGVGAWMVIAALLGTFVGSFVGGRSTRAFDRASIAYHSLVAWGLAVIAGALLVTFLTMGFVGAGSQAASTAAAANPTAAKAAAAKARAGTGTTVNTTDVTSKAAPAAGALGGAGVAISIGLLLTLVVSVLGWYLGSRKPLTSLERDHDPQVAAG